MIEITGPGKEYARERRTHWNEVARRYKSRRGFGGSYHHRLAKIYQNLIPPKSSVLELGCGTGDLLASLRPSRAVGVDFSATMLDQAREKHSDCEFIKADAHTLALEETFDFVILSDLLNDLWDVQTVLEIVHRHCHANTRLIINSYSHLWQIPLKIAAMLGLAKPNLEQNWLEIEEIINLLYQADFDTLRTFPEFLWPFHFPLIEPFVNQILVRFWPFNWFALTNVFVGRPHPQPSANDQAPTVSVMIPARNEAGNIPEIFKRVPQMGALLNSSL